MSAKSYFVLSLISGAIPVGFFYILFFKLHLLRFIPWTAGITAYAGLWIFSLIDAFRDEDLKPRWKIALGLFGFFVMPFYFYKRCSAIKNRIH